MTRAIVPVAILLLGGAAEARAPLLRRAIAAFERGRLQTATRLLARASARLEGRERAEALLYLGLARAYRAQHVEARAAFRRAIEEDPRIAIDRDRVPPAIARVFDRVRVSIVGTLEIQGGPPRGRVEVGDTGRWPLPFRQKVPAGRYAIVLYDAFGRPLWRDRVTVRAGQVRRVSLRRLAQR